MSSVDRLTKLAERFARKLSLGQAQVVNELDLVTDALKAAGLWDKSGEVAPMLTAAGCSDDPVTITFSVDKGLNFKYHVTCTPPAAAIKLANLVRVKYGAAMKDALVKAKVALTAPVDSKWLEFK